MNTLKARAPIVAVGIALVLLAGVWGCGETSSPNDPADSNGNSEISLANPIPGGDPPEATFNLADGSVCEVLQSVVQSGAHTTLYTRWNGGVVRTINIQQGTVPHSGWRGYRASISAGGTLSYSYEIYYDSDGYNMVIGEATPADALQIERTLLPDGIQIAETYTGTASTATKTAYLQVYEEVPQTPDPAGTGFDISDIVSMAPSVFNNTDGEWLVYLTRSEEFATWLAATVEDELGPPPLQRAGTDSCPTWFNAVNTACTIFKCAFAGGFANPICSACTAFTVTCVIVDMVNDYNGGG